MDDELIQRNVKFVPRSVIDDLKVKNLIHVDPVPPDSLLQNSLRNLINTHAEFLDANDSLILLPASIVTTNEYRFEKRSPSPTFCAEPENEEQQEQEPVNHPPVTAESFAAMEKLWRDFTMGRITFDECYRKVMDVAKNGLGDNGERILDYSAAEDADVSRKKPSNETVRLFDPASSLATKSPKFLKRMFIDPANSDACPLPRTVLILWKTVVEPNAKPRDPELLEELFRQLVEIDEQEFNYLDQYFMEEHGVAVTNCNPDKIPKYSADYYRNLLKKSGVESENRGEFQPEDLLRESCCRGFTMKRLLLVSNRLLDATTAEEARKLSRTFRNAQKINFPEFVKVVRKMRRCACNVRKKADNVKGASEAKETGSELPSWST